MKDFRVEKLADLLVNYSVAIKPGQKVFVIADILAKPLIQEVYKNILKAGGHPYVHTRLHELDELLYRFASDEQLNFVHSPQKEFIQTYDALIYILADGNTRYLSKIDPRKIAIHQQAATEMFKVQMDRTAKGDLAWTLTLFPTEAYAQDADMSLSDYEDFVYKACMPDLDNPIEFWQRLAQEQHKIVDWFKTKKEIHIVGPETDLRFSIDGRPFINCDCHVNVPDGEIYTSPVETSVEGSVFFSYPAIYAGHEVVGSRLWFEDGRVVRARAEKNEEFLIKTLDNDEGARRLGEFGIGMNKGIPQFTGQILFDEKISGSFHLALGIGFPECNGTNVSGIHWDMICDLKKGGEMWADNELFYRDGEFLI